MIEVPLRSPRGILFASCLLALTTGFLWSTTLAYRADRAAHHFDGAHLERAVQLEPLNAEYRHALGTYYLFTSQDARSAATQFEQSVKLNPHMARYWLDLAGVYQVLGNDPAQHQAIDHAVEVDPSTPDVAWESGSFYLLNGDSARAFDRFRVVMANSPEMDDQVISLCWRTSPDTELLLKKVIPDDPWAHIRFIKFLLAEGKPSDADRVFDDLVRLKQPFPVHEALFYVDNLIERKESAHARGAWAALMAANPSGSRYTASDNMMVNGGFEEPLLNDGFDWRFRASDNTSVTIDSTQFHEGTHSLAMVFSGEAMSAEPLYQIVPVVPGTRYEISLFVKSEEIYTALGPRVAVEDADAHHAAQYFVSPEFLGTNVWREVKGEFTTNSDTTFLKVRLMQNPPGGHIKGSLWLDGVRLVAK